MLSFDPNVCPVPFVQLYLDGTVISWNAAAEQLYGWSEREMLGNQLPEVLGLEPWGWSLITGSLNSKPVYECEERHRSKTGELLHVQTRYLLEQQAESPTITAWMLDISEKKRLQKQLLRSNRMECIGTITSGIAHDINNVLTPVLMTLELLKQKLTEEEDANLLSNLQSSVERGAGLVKQVLTFARGHETEKIPIHLRRVVLELEKVLRETFPRSIRLHVSVPDQLWTVLGDSTQLYQILMNLCVNSRDAMPQGGELFVEAENVIIDRTVARKHGASEGAYVLLNVRDTGMGIGDDIRKRIFDLFFTTKGPGEGTGLGLSTVQALVRAHRGFVHCMSKLGAGTTMQVYLPAADATILPHPETTVQLPEGNGELILVVDDEKPIQVAARKTLEAQGYAVLTANDGASAVSIFKQHHDAIRLVLTDMVMPGMDGSATAAEMRKIKPTVDIIAMSGMLGGGEEFQGLAGNSNLYLSKPFSAETLLCSINAVLNQRKSSGATGATISGAIAQASRG